MNILYQIRPYILVWLDSNSARSLNRFLNTLMTVDLSVICVFCWCNTLKVIFYKENCFSYLHSSKLDFVLAIVFYGAIEIIIIDIVVLTYCWPYHYGWDNGLWWTIVLLFIKALFFYSRQHEPTRSPLNLSTSSFSADSVDLPTPTLPIPHPISPTSLEKGPSSMVCPTIFSDRVIL